VLAEHAVGQSGRLFVVTDDRGWVTTLREASIPALEGDPADPAQYPSLADVVVVAAREAARAAAIASAAREAFPEATMLVAVEGETTPTQRDRLESLADRVVDPAAAVTTRVSAAAGGPPAPPLGRLLGEMRSLSKPLAVFAHDNPDPDAIASAVALAAIAESIGTPAEACYFGEITHQENRAMVNLLSLPIQSRDPETIDLSAYGAIALVDHARPGINDSLPPETSVSIVVDHHPPRAPLDETSGYLDVRPTVGSTSTIMVEYFRRLGRELETPLATALLYGIQTDTKRFIREVSSADYEAAATLSPRVDEEALARIESPSVNAAVLETLATAIDEREVRSRALVSCVGRLADRDALAQAADELLDMEGVQTVVVCGYADGVIYVSGRTREATTDLGETLREALGQIGSAGGHANMAGAQLPMGLLEESESDEALASIVHELVAERVFETLETTPERAAYMIDPPLRFHET
jgi:nanoRNase/pAp phosphatase (c-di-AMP/oligoRNAs hydrolase)